MHVDLSDDNIFNHLVMQMKTPKRKSKEIIKFGLDHLSNTTAPSAECFTIHEPGIQLNDVKERNGYPLERTGEIYLIFLKKKKKIKNSNYYVKE